MADESAPQADGGSAPSLRSRALGLELARTFARRASAPAVVTGEASAAHTWTFDDLARMSERIAAGLRRRGLRAGDRCALGLATSLDHLVSLLGILRAGLTVVPLNPLASPEEARFILDHAELSAAIVAERHAAIARDLVPLVTTDPGTLPDGSTDLTGEVGVDEDDAALLIYTSGTTGRPKGVLLSHRALVENLRAIAGLWGWTESDRLLLTLPSHHLHGLVLGCLAPFLIGSSVVLRDGFHPRRVPRDLESDRATMFFGVPTMYARLAALDEADLAGADLSRVRLWVSGSAPLPAALAARFEERFGGRIVERFGMSEGGFMVSTRPGAERPGSVGWPVPGVECRIVEPDELDRVVKSTESGTVPQRSSGGSAPGELRELPAGQVGELVVRGANLFSGYWRDSVATRRAFVDGWFRTGDLAMKDEEGAIRIVGRLSTDVIKSRGYKIGAVEIEECLASHPEIVEAAVVGVPDLDQGERVVAAVIAAPPGQLTDTQVIDFLRPRVAKHKLPSEVVFFDELPRVGPGKVNKRALAALLGNESKPG